MSETLMKCRVCGENPFKCHHIGSTTVKEFVGSNEFNEGSIQDYKLKIKDLEKKLALAEGEWKTYAKMSDELSKKLAEAELMRDINASQRDACMKMVLVAKEALARARYLAEEDSTQSEEIDEALKQLSEQ